MNHYKITDRREQKTKRKYKTEDKVNGWKDEV